MSYRKCTIQKYVCVFIYKTNVYVYIVPFKKIYIYTLFTNVYIYKLKAKLSLIFIHY